VLPEVLTRTRERVTHFLRFGSGTSRQAGSALSTAVSQIWDGS